MNEEISELLESYKNDVDFLKRKMSNIETILLNIAGLAIGATIKTNVTDSEKQEILKGINQLTDSLQFEENEDFDG